MGTPNSSAYDVPAVDFCPDDLFISLNPDEVRQAQKCGEIVFGVGQELRPILKYIAVPLPVLRYGYYFDGCSYRHGHHYGSVSDLYHSCIRGVKLLEVKAQLPGRKEFLFLGEDGDFFVSLLCSDGTKPDHYHGVVKSESGQIPMWSRAKFGWLIGALKRALTEATEKREQHLAAINQRTTVLDQLLAVLNREDAGPTK